MTIPDDFKTRRETYQTLIRQISEVYNPDLSRCANLCQALALLKKERALFWVGIYAWKDNKLLLDVFQGEVACTEIKPGQGACGLAAESGEIVNYRNVHDAKNYIACHHETASEIVIPAIKDGKVVFVLDADSEKPGYFNETDEHYLKEIAQQISEY